MARNLAIVVGVNTYKDRALSSLKYAKRDAEFISEFLSNQAEFVEVCLFSDDSLEFDGYSTSPSRYSLRKFLRERFESSFLHKDDHFWFFFSGHGIRYQDRDYLLPEDGDPDDPAETGIPLNWVTERLSRSGAGNIVLILDACRNEVGRKGRNGFGQEHQDGVTTIFSCKPEEASWEIDDPICHGAFTYILLEIFNNQTAKNCLTIEKTERHLQQRLYELNRQYKKRKQTPRIQISQTLKAKQALLPHLLPLRSIEKLKLSALEAEEKEDFGLAEELWVKILTNFEPNREEAIEYLKRIIEKKIRKSNQFVSIASSLKTRIVNSTQSVTDANQTTSSQQKKGKKSSSGIDRYEVFVAMGKSGKKADVDFFMKTLVESSDFATIKLIDFAMGLVKTRVGQKQIEHYLFNGHQNQRNYAALYFKRIGNKTILTKAFEQGCIDKIQAFSK